VIADAPERLAQSGDQLGAACSGLATLLFLVTGNSAASWAKTLSGVLAIAGLSLAGLTGTLKNSAQALLKRLRQDAYTDLVAVAVQTAPRPPNRSALQRAINRRGLTPATPH
jgi:phosphoglycolate phosphatase-like HAD superfamily hydrolase